MYLSSRKACGILGVHETTLRRWAETGKIKFIRTASGQRKYDVDDYLGNAQPERTICYCRVSSAKQRDDLDRQVVFMQEQFPKAEIIKDIGSGINFKRKGLLSILESALLGHKLRIVVAYKDRLGRFGTDLIKWVLERNGGELLVLNHSELSPEQELTQDLLTILHVFSCRMHGLRSYRNKIAADFAGKEPAEDIQKLD